MKKKTKKTAIAGFETLLQCLCLDMETLIDLSEFSEDTSALDNARADLNHSKARVMRAFKDALVFAER